MKGKNKKNNDNKQARTPVVSGELVNNEVLESAEGTPTNDFMEAPVSEKQKGVTLKDLAEIDPELLTGKSGENVPTPELPSLPASKNSKAAEPAKEEAPKAEAPKAETKPEPKKEAPKAAPAPKAEPKKEAPKSDKPSTQQGNTKK